MIPMVILTSEELKTVEIQIMNAMTWARLNNFTIVAGKWGVYRSQHGDSFMSGPGGCLCPMACVIIQSQQLGWKSNLELSQDQNVAILLGVDESWIDNFILGFDGDPARLGGPAQAYALGRKIRNQF